MSFESLELDPILLQAVEELGFTRPTTIQTQVIPVAMEGRDVMASAPTGTGKTAAFLLPMMLQVGFGLSPFESGSLTFAAAAGAAAEAGVPAAGVTVAASAGDPASSTGNAANGCAGSTTDTTRANTGSPALRTGIHEQLL